MARRKPPPGPGNAEGARLDHLVTAVEALRADLQALRASLADEIRTHRVIMVESDGFERLVATARDGFAHVTLYGRTAGDQPTCVELFANDRVDGTGAHVGVALTNRGEVVATFETTEDGRPRLWVAGDDERSPD